jgi:hypothetical protein
MLGDGKKFMVNLKKLKFWKNDIIEFYCHPDLVGVIPEPKPAVKHLPEWFKDLPPIYGEEDNRDTFGNRTMTAKRCLPLLDAMSYGFTIPLCGDVHIRTNHNNSQFEITNPLGLNVCEYHVADQVGGPSAIKPNHGNPLKFINYWVVKTAPGWSALFLNPLNHHNTPFTCLSAMVDTDHYPKEVNFPALWNVFDADEHIPAGTPLVTVIPIKRHAFDKKPNVRKITKKEFNQINKTQRIQNIRTHHYTYELREKK